jgi:hypothetical protein
MVTPPAGSPSPGAPIRPEHGPEMVEEFDAALVDPPATLSGHFVGPQVQGARP